MRQRPFDERFWRNVSTDTALCPGAHSPCWEWIGHKDQDGYGVFYCDDKRYRRAHRVVMFILTGEQPPEVEVCHQCDNPSCVNPDHLWLGTKVENQHDKVVKGRVARGDQHGSKTHPERLPRGERNGSRTHPESLARGVRHGSHTKPERILHGEQIGWSKLTEADVLHVRRLRCSDNPPAIRALAREYGVTPLTMKQAIVGVTWKHVPLPGLFPPDAVPNPAAKP